MENYYYVSLANAGGIFVFAQNAIDAIREARAAITSPSGRLPHDAPLGAAIVRRAAYGEWDCDTKHITIDGNHHH